MERNAKKREELKKQCDALYNEFLSKLAELDRRDEAENMSETEFDMEFERIQREHREATEPLYIKREALKFRETRNQWFIDFANSFGICESKRISEKQGNIFAKYGEFVQSNTARYASEYRGRYQNKYWKVTVGQGRAYITIIELQ